MRWTFWFNSFRLLILHIIITYCYCIQQRTYGRANQQQQQKNMLYTFKWAAIPSHMSEKQSEINKIRVIESFLALRGIFKEQNKQKAKKGNEKIIIIMQFSDLLNCINFFQLVRAPLQCTNNHRSSSYAIHVRFIDSKKNPSELTIINSNNCFIFHDGCVLIDFQCAFLSLSSQQHLLPIFDHIMMHIITCCSPLRILLFFDGFLCLFVVVIHTAVQYRFQLLK